MNVKNSLMYPSTSTSLRLQNCNSEGCPPKFCRRQTKEDTSTQGYGWLRQQISLLCTTSISSNPSKPCRRQAKEDIQCKATAGFASKISLFMYYVYRIQSLEYPQQRYTGFTSNVFKRLEAHNKGQVSHTSKYKPWKILNYFVFTDERKAKEFEVYLKSGSGRAFAQKHF